MTYSASPLGRERGYGGILLTAVARLGQTGELLDELRRDVDR
jgi:hypothetical protein